MRFNRVLACVAGLAIMFGAGQAAAQRHFSFGYDQPRTTGFGVAADIFSAALAKSSGGGLVIDQFPGAQLGQEPQALQKIRTGDIDFLITSTANAATLSPQSGVMSLHYLFTSETHLARSLADPAVVAAMRAMFDETVTGAPGPGPGDPRPARPVRQEGDTRDRRPARLKDTGAGDGDGRCDLPGLWRANCAHAVRQRLHQPANWRRGHGRERHQRLHGQ